MAAERDPKLYELLTLLDAIRGGRARESSIAIIKIRERLSLITASRVTNTIMRLGIET